MKVQAYVRAGIDQHPQSQHWMACHRAPTEVGQARPRRRPPPRGPGATSTALLCAGGVAEGRCVMARPRVNYQTVERGLRKITRTYHDGR